MKLTCAYADLYHACHSQANIGVEWKNWGWAAYCRPHHDLMTMGSKDVLNRVDL